VSAAAQNIPGWAWKLAGLLAILGSMSSYLLHAQRAQAVSTGHAVSAAVPVIVASVERRDVPVELKGIGAVQAYNTVTVKPRVSGQLIQVAFTEGQSIRQGAVLARIDPRPPLAQLHLAQANRAKDQAQLQNARRDLARLTEIVLKGYVSRQSVDAQESQVAVYQAAVQADDAAVENAQVQLDYTTVTAPIEGVTGIRMVDVGNMITPTDPGLVVITQVQPIAVIFALPADLVATLGLGQARQPLPVDVFDRDDKVKLTSGTLALLDNQIDRATNTVRLKALFDNADGVLRPGEFVNARLRKTVLHNATAIPPTALQYDEQGAFAWLVRPDSTVIARRVIPGTVSGGLVTIESGLSPGERVVIDGQYNLRNNTVVRVNTSAAAVSGGDSNALSIP
jgi:membrane fusion protein, multidrug efflux system